MTPIPDAEIQAIVQRVLHRTLGTQPAVQSVTDLASHAGESRTFPLPAENVPLDKVVAIGADHGGFGMKENLISFLKELSYNVVDCGTVSTESVDYPDFALEVARLVSVGKAWRGIVVDGAGIGSCMVANKLPGVRAALCYDHATALNSREHNDANVLTLGAGLIGIHLARQIVKIWLETEFGGGRHAQRVAKIAAIEKLFLKSGN